MDILHGISGNKSGVCLFNILVCFLDASLGQSTQGNTNLLLAPPDLYLNMISRNCTIFYLMYKSPCAISRCTLAVMVLVKTSVHKSKDLLYLVHFIYFPKIIPPHAQLASSLNFSTSWNSELDTALSNSQKLKRRDSGTPNILEETEELRNTLYITMNISF